MAKSETKTKYAKGDAVKITLPTKDGSSREVAGEITAVNVSEGGDVDAKFGLSEGDVNYDVQTKESWYQKVPESQLKKG